MLSGDTRLQYPGGGLDVRGNLHQEKGFLSVENCSSHPDGAVAAMTLFNAIKRSRHGLVPTLRSGGWRCQARQSQIKMFLPRAKIAQAGVCTSADHSAKSRAALHTSRTAWRRRGEPW